MLFKKIYNMVVRTNENVRYEYERYVMEHTVEHYESRIKHWKLLWKLNWHYRVRKSSLPMLYFDRETGKSNSALTGNKSEKVDNVNPAVEKKKQSRTLTDYEKFVTGPESCVASRAKPYHYVLDLLKYDVISFDVFDTLLLRPFASPVDLFDIVGKRLDYPEIFTGFKKARREAEKEARDELEKRLGTREVNIYEIYEQLEKKIGIDKKKGVEAELAVELDYLFPNPYMQLVFHILKSQGKRIVLTSDMYIPGKIMEEIVKHCGYSEYEKLYVSCDYRCNKSSGELYRRVLKDYKGNKIIHVGDNAEADINGAKKVGIDTRFYKNVNKVGNQFRGEWMSALTGSAYSGLVNAYIHNGMNQYPLFYEYGFVYGGIYVFGFCNWIERKAKEQNIDKIIFLSRDGDIYQKVYNKYFGSISNEYVLWSRFANVKYLIENNHDMFIERVVKQKVYGALSIELSSIIKAFELPLNEEDLKKYGLYMSSEVSRYNLEAIKHCIDDNWNKILTVYQKEKITVADEVKKLIGDAKKIAVIDVGWTASGPIGFKYFVKQNISKDIEIKCWMAGGAGQYGTGSSILPDYLDDVVDAYLFSPLHNRRNEQIHVSENVAITNNAAFELFTQATYPSYRGRGENEGYSFDIPETENYELIEQIHKGVLDFCESWYSTFGKDSYLYNIGGHDAYRPFVYLAFHKQYFENNFKNIVIAYGLSGDDERQCIETIGARMKNFYANNGGEK